MSEDSAQLTFKVQKEKSSKAESFIKDFSKESGVKCIESIFNRGKYNASFESIDIDPEFFEALEKLHCGLVGLEAQNIITEIYFDQVGESDYYKSYGNELKMFSSLKDLKDYEIELNSRVDLSQLNFSKNSLKDTVLARFHCPSKNKRKKLAGIFEALIHEPLDERQSSFSASSEVILKSAKYQEVKWCAYRDVDPDGVEPSGPWYQGVPEIFDAIDFISEQGDYLFVGFDAEKVDYLQSCKEKYPHENGFRWWDSFENRLSDMAKILAFIDGVKDVLIKYRLENFPNEEYMTQSGKSFRSQNKSKDDNWVFPANYTDQNGKPV